MLRAQRVSAKWLIIDKTLSCADVQMRYGIRKRGRLLAYARPMNAS